MESDTRVGVAGVAGVAADAAAVDAAPKRKAWRDSWRPGPMPRQTAAPAGGGAVYGLGMMGALVYYLRSTETGRDYVLAFPRASVWPALIVYKLLKHFYG